MAELRCSFCARLKGEPHTPRCSVTKGQFGDQYVEFPGEILGERDRYRAALELIVGTIETSSVTRRAAIKAVEIAREALEGPADAHS